MFTEFFLAKRYIKPRRNAVSLITVTSILGVTLGVAVLIIVLAVMTGFTDLMKSKLMETQAHFQISKYRYAMASTTEVMNAIKDSGASGAPVIQSPVLVQYRKNRLDAKCFVLGVGPEKLDKHLSFKNYLHRGKLELENRKIIISTNMANRWQLDVGDKVLLHSTNRLTNLVNFSASGKIEINKNTSAYLPTEFTIAGIYSMGKYDFDSAVFFMGIDDAAELFDLPWGAATAVFGWGKDPFNQDKLIKDIRAKLPDSFRVATWQENNQQLLGVLAVEKRMMFFLLIFIVLVAAFSIANTLITSVYQKTKEIGLLKALGTTDRGVLRIFVLQGFLIGLIGSIIGMLLGFTVIAFRNDILSIVSRITGQELFPKEFYFFNELPAHIVTSDVLIVVISSIILCTLGAVIPAIRAARLDSAKALRYE